MQMQDKGDLYKLDMRAGQRKWSSSDSWGLHQKNGLQQKRTSLGRW